MCYKYALELSRFHVLGISKSRPEISIGFCLIIFFKKLRHVCLGQNRNTGKHLPSGGGGGKKRQLGKGRLFFKVLSATKDALGIKRN